MFLFSEKDLVAKLKDPGTRNYAFNAVVKQYKEKIYWYVRRLVIDFEDAKDVTQNVFIKAWLNLDDFKYQCSIYTWLYRIATNESLNHIEKRKRHFLHTKEEKMESEPVAHQYISGNDIHILLEKAVACLPERQRVVFILRYFEDKSYDEIAGITGITAGALQASYHHAVNKIEKKLQGD